MVSQNCLGGGVTLTWELGAVAQVESLFTGIIEPFGELRVSCDAFLSHSLRISISKISFLLPRNLNSLPCVAFIEAAP